MSEVHVECLCMIKPIVVVFILLEVDVMLVVVALGFGYTGTVSGK